MAIEHINIGLAANFMDGRAILRSDFVGQLQSLDHCVIKDTAFDRSEGLSSLITFMEAGLIEFEKYEDPYLEIENTFRQKAVEIAAWLSIQDSTVFEGFALTGLKVWLFIEMWIESNQMDLSLPPSLLLECGKLNLPVEIVTGE